MNNEIKCFIDSLKAEFYGPHDFVPTFGNRGQHHPHGLVGKLWRINNPETVSVGHCFLAGRLKKGDLFLCIGHSGDCFQDYMYVEEYSNALVGKPQWKFGSYGIGDSTEVDYSNSTNAFETLKSGGTIKI